MCIGQSLVMTGRCLVMAVYSHRWEVTCVVISKSCDVGLEVNGTVYGL